ncbi:MAG: polyprenyl synthetase family protein, partial [Chloroflexi bacterium]|nr:polyprenyl synthetase family protein [Chloroflexota bacterium]
MRTTNKPPNVPADAPADDMLTGLLARYNRAVRRALVDTIDAHDTSNPFYGIMRYHLGLADARLQPIDAPSGKGLRGALLMLTAAACGGAERDILPLAAPLGAAVEFLHSFSLVHDDIEDGSATRRHRATVWAIWGAPIGINAGDGLYALAHLALFRSPLRETNPTAFIDVMHTFETATLRLAEGQHRDMALQDERVANVSVEDYLGMIEGKTATLIGAAATIGARAAGADVHRVDAAARFGRELGMAFQMQDDILGIWGDERVTGKS